MKDAFGGKTSSDKDFTSDEWSKVISGYAPIKNRIGEVVGIVGVDIYAS